MKRAAILLPRLDPGDAVGNDARSQAEVLTEAGFETRIFAAAWSRETPANSLSGFARFVRSDSTVIYHPASYWPEGSAAFAEAKGRRFLKYHNVTPAHFFAPFNPDYARICDLTRKSLADLVRVPCEGILCDSHFNLEDIVREGASRDLCKVIAPFHRLESRTWAGFDPLWVERFTAPEEPVFLSVGRIVPNKAYEHLITALGVLQRRTGIRARLVLAGRSDPRLSGYTTELERIASRETRRGSVIFTGHIPEKRLRSLFLSAKAYVVSSAHEGFCVPVIESMKTRLPVIACGRTAVEETLGGQGIYWNDFDADLFSFAMQRLIEDPAACADIADHAHAFYEDSYHTQALAARFVEMVK